MSPGLLSRLRYSPFLAQMVVIRRCNLSCGYCSEFDKTSDPVPFEILETRLEKLKASLKPDGALWIIRPKGRPEISERATMAAGKAAGLVDVKVVGFSPTHTAEKFVIPVGQRPSP